MRIPRILGAGAALVLAVGMTAGASGAGAVTFHGTFTGGTVYSAGAGGSPLFEMPVRGNWNLNVNVSQDPAGIAKAALVVKMVGGGLHALWTEDQMDLAPLMTPSRVGDVIPEARGVVNDPAAGVWAYTTAIGYRHATMVVVLDANSGAFFYAAVPGEGYTCDPDDTGCYDSVLVEGHIR